MISLSLHPQQIRIVFLHQMKKCLRRKILPRRFFLMTMSFFIQEQVAIIPTGSRRKTWMTLPVICIYLSSSQEFLASWLKQWNLVKVDGRITRFRTRNKDFASFFNMENRLCYCTNVSGLFTFLGFPHHPSEWHLFIGPSSEVWRLCSCHNGNKYPSLPIVHSLHLKESYDNMEPLLEVVKYNQYQWSLCGDLKFIGLLTSMPSWLHKVLLPSLSPGQSGCVQALQAEGLGGLGALLCLVNTVSKKILGWAWTRCFFLLFISRVV